MVLADTPREAQVRRFLDPKPQIDPELRQAIIEGGDEFLVVGIIMPTKERWATIFRAQSARQAEDLAQAQVGGQVVNGITAQLWVAGVAWLDAEGHLAMADDYAHFVDPDEPVT